MNKLIFLITAALLTGCFFLPDDDELVVMTWNVQNLFDDVRQGSEYSEFDPENGSWNTGLYHLKLAAIADVIKSPEAGSPDIILLQEVENSRVIEDLVEIYLKNKGYIFFDVSAEDFGAVHTAVISRYSAGERKAHLVWGPGLAEQRYIMQYSFYANKKDIVIFNNHWKSKAGSNCGDEERLAASKVLGTCSAAVLGEKSLVMAGGDFNSCYGDHAFGELYWTQPENGTGSYAYNGQWEAIDLLVLSDSLQGRLEEVYYCNPCFILNSSGYPKAFNAASGQGYSDHLPLVGVFDIE